MIQSFSDERTRLLCEGKAVGKLQLNLQRQATKRLMFLALAKRLEDLYFPPSNKFHALAGSARYAISVNMQWRITFEWSDAGPANVLFEDYH